MSGGVSHVSFDQAILTKYGGKTVPKRPRRCAESKRLAIERLGPDASGSQRNTLYPLQTGFKKHGQSGIEVSDWFPHLARQVDHLAVVRSLWTTDSNHGAQTQFHTGRNMLDGEFPTLGAWVHYGLGSLNDDLPQFISIGTREYWKRRTASISDRPRRCPAAHRSQEPTRLWPARTALLGGCPERGPRSGEGAQRPAWCRVPR